MCTREMKKGLKDQNPWITWWTEHGGGGGGGGGETRTNEQKLCGG